MPSGYPVPSEIREDLRSLEEALASTLEAESPRLSEAANLVLKAGGKRLRPALVLMSARVGDYDLARLLPTALAVELIHMASLIHDDILDEASLRRGSPTINSVWGRRTAVAVGDYIFGIAFVHLSKLGNPRIIDVMAEASESLSQGEWLELSLAFDPDQTIDDYMRRINKKTASLFSACCLAGGLLSGAPAAEIKALKRFGENLGMAFQIRDDLLDIWGNEDTLGKPVGSDLREGIATLPYFLAQQKGRGNGFLRTVISTRASSDRQIREAIEIMLTSGVREESEQVAEEYFNRAMDALQDVSSEAARSELGEVARFVVERYS